MTGWLIGLGAVLLFLVVYFGPHLAKLLFRRRRIRVAVLKRSWRSLADFSSSLPDSKGLQTTLSELREAISLSELPYPGNSG